MNLLVLGATGRTVGAVTVTVTVTAGTGPGAGVLLDREDLALRMLELADGSTAEPPSRTPVLSAG